MNEEAQVPEKQRWALILEMQKAKSLIYDPINTIACQGWLL